MRSAHSEVTWPLFPVGRRRLLILLVITALVLLTFDQRGNRVIDGARTGFIGVTSPLRSLARVVASPARNAWYGLTRYDDLKQENDELRDRIEAQDGAAIAAEAVVYENQELKSEFGLPTLSEHRPGEGRGHLRAAVELRPDDHHQPGQSQGRSRSACR